jgi:hypothetical protein
LNFKFLSKFNMIFFFYFQAMKAGLTPTETVAPHTTQITEALLNIGLENNSRSFLVSCIKEPI